MASKSCRASVSSPAPKTWRMAGEYLFDQRRARPRQADDEHGPICVETGSREPSRKKADRLIGSARLTRRSCSSG